MQIYIVIWGIILGTLLFTFRMLALRHLSDEYKGKMWELMGKFSDKKYFDETGLCYSRIATIMSLLLAIHIILLIIAIFNN